MTECVTTEKDRVSLRTPAKYKAIA